MSSVFLSSGYPVIVIGCRGCFCQIACFVCLKQVGGVKSETFESWFFVVNYLLLKCPVNANYLGKN